MTLTRADVERLLAAAIDAESTVGLPWWPGVEMAPIAFRRWTTFGRRHNSKRSTVEDKVLDLAKGLQAHFEPDIPYNPLSEWLHLASLLRPILETYLETA